MEKQNVNQVKLSDEDLAKIQKAVEDSRPKGYFEGMTQQVSPKDAMQFVKENPEVLKLLLLKKGGKVTDENYDMLRGKIKEVKHHASELQSITNRKKQVPAWVLAKSTRASTDLSDITHYMDSQKFSGGGGVDNKGGAVPLSEKQKDTLYNSWVNAKNKLIDLSEDLKKAKRRKDGDSIIEINKAIKITKQYVSSFQKMMKENDIKFSKGGGVDAPSEEDARKELEKLKSEGKITLSVGNHGLIFMQIVKTGNAMVSSFKQSYESYLDALKHYYRVRNRFTEGGGVPKYKVAGREVTIDKKGTNDQTKWKVTFINNGKTADYLDVLALITPRPKFSGGGGVGKNLHEKVKKLLGDISVNNHKHKRLRQSYIDDIYDNFDKNPDYESVLRVFGDYEINDNGRTIKRESIQAISKELELALKDLKKIGDGKMSKGGGVDGIEGVNSYLGLFKLNSNFRGDLVYWKKGEIVKAYESNKKGIIFVLLADDNFQAYDEWEKSDFERIANPLLTKGGGVYDDEGNVIDLKIGDKVVEFRQKTPNNPKSQIGGEGKIIQIVGAMAKVVFEPNDYEQWVALKDLKKIGDGKMSKGGGVESTSHIQGEIDDIRNWDNDEIANYIGVPISYVARDRNRYVREAQNYMMLNNFENGGAIGGNEMWDKDSSNRDNYFDNNDERNYEEEDEELPLATLKYEKNGIYTDVILYDDEDGEEYRYRSNRFSLYKSQQEFEKDVKYMSEMGRELEKFYKIEGDNTYEYAILYPYYPAKSEDFGGKYSNGGNIGFKELSSGVAKRYQGKAVAPKYQSEYGKRYSKSEAREVGDKVAGKVYWQQQGRKFDSGGKIQLAEEEEDEYGYGSGKIYYILGQSNVGQLSYVYHLKRELSEGLPKRYKNEMYIDYVEVDSNQRGKGIATKLLEEAKKIAKQLGIEVITLRRDEGVATKRGSEYDQYLKRIYERLGFLDIDSDEDDTSMFLETNKYSGGGGVGEYEITRTDRVYPYSSYKLDTTIESLKKSGWEISDSDIEKLNEDGEITIYGGRRGDKITIKKTSYSQGGGVSDEGSKYEVILKGDRNYGKIGVSLNGWETDNRGRLYTTLSFDTGVSTYGEGEVEPINYSSRYTKDTYGNGGSVDGLSDLMYG